MSRDYWVDVSIRIADGPDDSGYASGGRIDLGWSDESIREILNEDVEYIMYKVTQLRELEAKRDRKAAAPFWKKWLGGV